MAANVFGQKVFKPTPPDKGSFPLDHDNECKKFYLRYMVCLSDNKSDNSKCRESAKSYLECRMEKNLMAKENLTELGYGDLVDKDKKNAESAASAATGK